MIDDKDRSMVIAMMQERNTAFIQRNMGEKTKRDKDIYVTHIAAYRERIIEQTRRECADRAREWVVNNIGGEDCGNDLDKMDAAIMGKEAEK